MDKKKKKKLRFKVLTKPGNPHNQVTSSFFLSSFTLECLTWMFSYY